MMNCGHLWHRSRTFRRGIPSPSPFSIESLHNHSYITSFVHVYQLLSLISTWVFRQVERSVQRLGLIRELIAADLAKNAHSRWQRMNTIWLRLVMKPHRFLHPHISSQGGRMTQCDLHQETTHLAQWKSTLTCNMETFTAFDAKLSAGQRLIS